MDALRTRLARLIIERSSLKADHPKYLLASGERSRFYFDCKRTTFHAPAFHLIGSLFLAEIREAESRPQAVGGLTQGADPIAFATAIVAGTEGQLDVFSVRKEPKSHGTCSLIENCPADGARVVVVDDVVTSGGSVNRAIEGCRKTGLRIVQVIVLIDREAGGLQAIQRQVDRGVRVGAIFTKSELDEVEARPA